MLLENKTAVIYGAGARVFLAGRTRGIFRDL